ncbi:MAG: cysteine methyltransferase [Planctomycetes bacterium]|nr:cysteine methyltransferase [Planctomycetota bacterium]
MTTQRAEYFDTPLGPMLAVVNDAGQLTRLDFSKGRSRARFEQEEPELKFDARACATVRRQTTEYFRGRRRDFDLDVAPVGTEFQCKVWRTLLDIPYGETWSYGQLARRIRKPTASRAVGAANGKNPIAIIIPCHRVIGSNGTLTGYGGGLSKKEKLLELEGALPDATGSLF